MNLLLFIEFCLSFFFLFLALVVHNRNPYDNFYKLSSLALAMLFAAIFYEFLSIISLGYGEASILSKLANSFWLFSAALMLHSLLHYGQNPLLNNKFGLALIYVPPLLVASNLFTNYALYSGFINTPSGIIPSPNYYYFLFLTIECIYLILSSGICFSVWRSNSDVYRKKQSFLLGSAFVVAFAGMTSNYFSLLSHHTYPLINVSFWIIGAFIAITASVKYHLFPRYPAVMGETIFKFLPDILLVTDLKGRISLANKIFYRLARLGEGRSVISRTLAEVMEDEAAANFLIHYIFKHNRSISDCPLIMKDITLSLNAGPIRDNTGDKIGMVMIGRDVTERKKNESDLKNKTETLAKNLKEIDVLNRRFVEREIEMSKIKEEIDSIKKRKPHG